ncbi:hypothetical protein BV20DRAFT_943334 [Pilatotrama ljubarskyi]|nr:hypothetical protein BV20DRAFT_943334 [Pilatotrama ljubarskyi]
MPPPIDSTVLQYTSCGSICAKSLGTQQAEPSPPKKRKLMHTPDGFESSRRAAAKAPARKFASAFENTKRSKLSSKPMLARKLSPLPPPPVAGPSNRPISPPAVRLPPKQHSRIPVPRQPVSEPSLRPAQRRNASILAAHRVSAPVQPKVPAEPFSKGTLQQFQPVLPPPAPSKDPPRNLRPLQPPPVPAVGPAMPDASKLKTISTTRVAVAMDPRTESGTDELLGIYLEQNAASYVPPAERELQRGLGQSPEKASKAKSAKVHRGGLAERAQRIFAKHSTTLTLWYKDMELQAQRPQAHSRVTPDLCLRVAEVLHVSSVASLQRSQSVPRLCVARCTKAASGSAREEDVAVVLDFGNPGSAAARAHTLDDLKEGKGLQVWRPWNTTKIAEELPGESADTREAVFRLPPNCSILFCSRFRIVI